MNPNSSNTGKLVIGDYYHRMKSTIECYQAHEMHFERDEANQLTSFSTWYTLYLTDHNVCRVYCFIVISASSLTYKVCLEYIRKHRFVGSNSCKIEFFVWYLYQNLWAYLISAKDRTLNHKIIWPCKTAAPVWYRMLTL